MHVYFVHNRKEYSMAIPDDSIYVDQRQRAAVTRRLPIVDNVSTQI